MAPKVDKQSFLNLAPEYYLLALYIHSQYAQQFYTDVVWQREFTVRDHDSDQEYCYVENAALRAEAIRIMLSQGAIEIIEDHFGPTIWKKTPKMEELASELENTPGNVFFKAKVSGDARGWLYAALQKVNQRAFELEISDGDFEPSVGPLKMDVALEVSRPDPVNEWAPIKLDPADPVVAEAVDKLSAATQAIEQDNGYAAERTQERDAVVSDLKGGLEKIKSGEVSVGWIRRTILALRTASITFANNVKAQTIDGAMLGLKEVVKVHMKDAIETLMHHWPF
ncbi:hypothetical protein [Bradyrhizobium guangzhouense]|uniref:Uncharacterized protein n=1 Tax=Bradyrhizobium guangzhouense TaxID=1325095 RepID=A0AAE5X6F4_9BRAD|nr:hypothetical protein [Bradyrhizobium guangzhouense]QAU49667.1 hypothetical protein XH91_32750 [Bradyrhizobium guangzhouense]